MICIDCGSTAVFLAHAIRDRFFHLTVITHNLDVFEVLRHKEGFRDYHPQLLAVQRKNFESSDRVFILADSEKFEATALFKLSEADPSFVYFTDPALPAHLRQLYREQGLHLITNSEEMRKEEIP